ncbi:MAG: IS5 family transposase [Halobacteria archaeon]
MQTKLSRFTDNLVRLAKKSFDGEKPALDKGGDGYSDWVTVSIYGLKQYLGHTYRVLMDVLTEMPGIIKQLELTLPNLPNFSTVSNNIEEIKYRKCDNMLKNSTNYQKEGEVQAVDTSGFDRTNHSKRYRKKTDYTFKALKTSLLIDCKTNKILDVTLSPTRPHDTRMMKTHFKKSKEKINILTADKAYDSKPLREKLKLENIRPVIKHREFDSLDKAHNARIDDDVYNKRSNAESVFSSLKRRYGDKLHSKKLKNQIKEIQIKCIVKNIADTIKN